MSSTAITVHNLSKRYLIGHRSSARSRQDGLLREAIVRETKSFFRRTRDLARGTQVVQGDTVEEFWALRDVGFEVKRGEVLGLVGKNGAGKSTLLKILSRITPPDTGRAILSGRVASLLEVGTGFHPELTGRENTYLNGAILGMTKAEITARFDEIVSFAEIDQFIDTPVKRYSSGMYVRLAFAIAAHLESDILIVDEVLAVGDAEFQRKCLGKINSFTSGDRTVLFVSHNMSAVQSLCDRAILFDRGRIVEEGSARSVVQKYLSQAQSEGRKKQWVGNLTGNDDLSLLSIEVSSSANPSHERLSSGHDIHVDVEFFIRTIRSNLCIGFDLTDSDGAVVFRTYQTDAGVDQWPRIELGLNKLRCIIPKGLLNAGAYSIHPRIGIHNMSWIVHEDAVLQFTVELGHAQSPLWTSLAEQAKPGSIAPILSWRNGAQGVPQ